MKNIVIENAKIIFRNFSGKGDGMYNPPGKRSFCVLLDETSAAELSEDGWNVKTLKPREEGDQPRQYLQVAVSYENIPPKIILITSRGKTLLDATTVSSLDWAEIENVDMTIRPYHWEANGRTGVKAYVKSMWVTIVEDAFESKYADIEMEGDMPF